MGLQTAAQILAIRPRRKVCSRGGFGCEGHGKRANSHGLSQSVAERCCGALGGKLPTRLAGHEFLIPYLTSRRLGRIHTGNTLSTRPRDLTHPAMIADRRVAPSFQQRWLCRTQLVKFLFRATTSRTNWSNPARCVESEWLQTEMILSALDHKLKSWFQLVPSFAQFTPIMYTARQNTFPSRMPSRQLTSDFRLLRQTDLGVVPVGLRRVEQP